MGYLRMKTDSDATDFLGNDVKDLANAFKKFANHSIKLASLGFGTSFLEWVASFAAIYLLILDRTNWKTNILTSLLIPYIFFTLPSLLFDIFRGDIGKWIACVAIVLRLFFPQHFPDWLELPASLILLIVVAPSLISGYIRDGWIGLVICLVIACYLLQEHIRASGGFRNAFTKAHGVSNTVGIVILFVYPVWALVLGIL
ncbi:cold-regulated 413 plasma membrane protein 1-like [Humulus lupulus]|uniref:cold-regulated 413 plasma membrane protein 1-like n=1 Tax=Humulus lupulus TaxID=3486 RepID=UPI002B403F99|nr:cold-regulated 413 plasma membrane protein 1-like [Humulus lupulus]